MSVDPDGYAARYSDKLWRMLPEVYRAADAPSEAPAGPLWELCRRVGAQAAVVRRSIDRLWDDQAIETADDWVIAYLGELVATQMVPSLDARGQRLDVAKTIYYRRRKGTVPLLEELAHDLTGWDVVVVEMFQRLARTRHRLDPELTHLAWRPRTTPPGGFADLRSAHTAARAGTAFDTGAHTIDVRVGRGRTGWHNLARLGVFLWRKTTTRVAGVVPVADPLCPGRLTFDPSGREVPLQGVVERAFDDTWATPREAEVRGPLSGSLCAAGLDAIYDRVDAAGVLEPRSVGLYRLGGTTPAWVPDGEVTADLAAFTGSVRYFIDPERGLLYVRAGASADLVTAHGVALMSHLGAGAYERRGPGRELDPARAAVPPVVGGGAWFTGAAPTGTTLIADSRTYTQAPALTVAGRATIAAGAGERPLLRLGADWIVKGLSGVAAELELDGLWIAGGDLILEGDFETVRLRAMTLDPGERATSGSGFASAIDGVALRPTSLRVKGRVTTLIVERSIVGPVVVTGQVERVIVRDAIVQGLTGHALDVPGGAVELTRVTVLGTLAVHRLSADGALLHDIATVVDHQHGCVRMSAWASGSVLPRRFSSHEIAPRTPLFESTRFGQPGFAALLSTAPEALRTGADGDTEIGAFARAKIAVKERSLLVKFQEYMPFGLAPVLVRVT